MERIPTEPSQYPHAYISNMDNYNTNDYQHKSINNTKIINTSSTKDSSNYYQKSKNLNSKYEYKSK